MLPSTLRIVRWSGSGRSHERGAEWQSRVSVKPCLKCKQRKTLTQGLVTHWKVHAFRLTPSTTHLGLLVANVPIPIKIKFGDNFLNTARRM